MNYFIYEGRTYIRCIPAKALFHSTMVHEVVNRGDVFAIDMDSSKLTIIPGNAPVEHFSNPQRSGLTIQQRIDALKEVSQILQARIDAKAKVESNL